MQATNPIRVMIVDDHDMVRQGLTVLLDSFSDLELVGQAQGGQEALNNFAGILPDVLIIDLVMPGVDGVSAIRAIHEKYPNVQIIALTNFKDEDLVYSALQAGAISYLLKNVSIDELAEAIRAANAGKSTLAPEAAQALVKAATRPPTPGHDLTEREREVLALVVTGLNNSKIADRLMISQSTVKNHVSNIFSKLGVSNRAEAVALAVQYNLVH